MIKKRILPPQKRSVAIRVSPEFYAHLEKMRLEMSKRCGVQINTVNATRILAKKNIKRLR